MAVLTLCTRVRRDELVNESDAESEGSNGEDDALRARLEAQMAQTLGLVDIGVGRTVPVSSGKSQSRQKRESRSKHPSSHAAGEEPPQESSPSDSDDSMGEDQPDTGDDDGREEYDFCLFGGTGAPTKVVLEDDSRPRGEGGLEISRPRTFYLASTASAEDKRRYLYAAVTGDQVLERSRQRWWGMEYPWRVTHITTTVKTAPDGKVQVQAVSEEEKGKRRRPGKKRRLAVRKKDRAQKQKEEAVAKKAEEKEEHIKEKKKRMNRLKKMRKRAKNREAKAATKGDGGEKAEEDGSDSSD